MFCCASNKLFSRCQFLLRNFTISTVRLELDYYIVLGVTSNASSEEIKKAYLQKCKEYHPDKNKGSTNMQAKFIQANTAYNILNNPEKRRQYDARSKKFPHGRPYYQQSPYKWGNNTQARPEDVFREYRSSHYSDRKHSNSTWRYRDPIYRHWQNVYENPNSRARASKNDFKHPYNFVETKYLIMFFGTLCVILYVRFIIAFRSYRYSNRHQVYSHNHYNIHDYPKNDREMPVDPSKPIDLNVETEDV